jgi:hypothetical protein
MSFVLQGGTFTRTFQAAELETLNLKLIGSQQSYFKTDGIAVILLSELGYLLLILVDGMGSNPGRTLFENYNFSFDASYEFSVRLTSKTLSENATFSQGLEAHSFLGLAPLTNLAAICALTYIVSRTGRLATGRLTTPRRPTSCLGAPITPTLTGRNSTTLRQRTHGSTI